MDKNLRDSFIEIQITMLNAQTKALKKLKDGKDAPETKKTGKSQVEYVYDILKDSGRALHVTDIIKIAEKKYRIRLDRESVVSALTKKVLKGDRFIRTDKNTFALKEDKQPC